MSYAERIKEIQKEKGLSLRKMAEIIDVPEKTVQNWLYGRSFPPPDKFERLVRVLGANPLYILTGEGPPLLPTDVSFSYFDAYAKKNSPVRKRKNFVGTTTIL